MKACLHNEVTCVNSCDIVRKYRCASCSAVMMCACEEEFATRYLPHQITKTTDPHTRESIPVTHGFQPAVCNACRGLPEDACPRAPTHGKMTKIRRYYWREIHVAAIRRFGEWCEQHGHSDWLIASGQHRGVFQSIEKEVIEDIKRQHASAPKYSMTEPSQAEILDRYDVEITRLDAEFETVEGRPLVKTETGDACPPEVLAQRHFERQGYQVILTESRPFHVLFGIFFWMVFQDPDDPFVRLVGFGSRTDFDAGTKPNIIETLLPKDFGAPAYASRRKAAIDEHFATFPDTYEEMQWLFDLWLDPSKDLRQYLWAHAQGDIDCARQVLAALPVETTKRILRYLIENYWKRYCGWPDLLAWRADEYLFAEVKASRDKLSADQRRWIADNHDCLKLPFRLIKIHRQNARKGGRNG